MLPTKILGNTDLHVSILGLGTSPLSGDMGKIDRKTALKILCKALDMGINFFDTANSYGNGLSEELIGQAFSNQRDKVIIATKGGTEVGGANVRYNFEPSFIKTSLEKSLKRLKTDYIDLYQLHNPRPCHFQNHKLLETLEQLKKTGKIRHFGISLSNVNDYSAAIDQTNAQAYQVEYNILNQSPEMKIFHDAITRKVGVIARAPLSQGVLTGKYTYRSRFSSSDLRSRTHKWLFKERVSKVENLILYMNYDINNLIEKAIRFCLSAEAVSTVIIGARKAEQITKNIEIATKGPLSEEELSKIKKIAEENFYIKPTTQIVKVAHTLCRPTFYKSLFSMQTWRNALLRS